MSLHLVLADLGPEPPPHDDRDAPPEATVGEPGKARRFDSAAGNTRGETESNLKWHTAGGPDEGDVAVPLVGPYLAEGSLTLVVALPKAGKSTLLAHVTRAVVNGGNLFGVPTKRGPVLWATEAAGAAFKATMKSAGLPSDGLHWLYLHEVFGLSWEARVAAMRTKAREVGAVMVIVDTWDPWTGLEGDAANSAGATNAALAPLQALCGDGLSVAIIQHARKSGGSIHEIARGSGALAGGVDTILAVQSTEGKGRRLIRCVSRMPCFPEELVVELTEGEYRPVGSPGVVSARALEEHILELLPSDEPMALTVDELRERLTAADTPASKTVAVTALTGLQRAGKVSRRGKGVRNDPFRYWLRFDSSTGKPVQADAFESGIDAEGEVAHVGQ